MVLFPLLRGHEDKLIFKATHRGIGPVYNNVNEAKNAYRWCW